MKEQILNHIREVCNLKRLEFGCEVEYQKEKYICCGPTGMMTDIHQGCIPYKYFKKKGSGTMKEMHDEYEYEIIGLPVELNHLLFSLPQTAECLMGIDSGFAVLRVDNCVIKYDLTKSVSENLDNPELCSLVAELLDIKE